MVKKVRFKQFWPKSYRQSIYLNNPAVIFSESEGETPRHVVVMCRGRMFIMPAVDEKDEPLTPPELSAQFQIIRDTCDRGPEGPGIGALTGDNRTTWAQVGQNKWTTVPPVLR